MNWRTGLFRLWATGAVVWVAGSAWLQYRKERALRPPEGFYLVDGLHYLSFWAEVIAVPVAVAVVGLLLAWTIRGFRKSG